MRLVCAWCGAALIHLSQNELQLGDVVLHSEALCFGGFDADVDHHVAVARGQGRVVAGVEAEALLVIPVACTIVRRDQRHGKGDLIHGKRDPRHDKRGIQYLLQPVENNSTSSLSPSGIDSADLLSTPLRATSLPTLGFPPSVGPADVSVRTLCLYMLVMM